MKRIPATEVVTESTAKAIKDKKIQLRYSTSKKATNKYSKQFQLHLLPGYDLLENFIVARPYIQKMYKLDIALFEILLFLSAKQYFTQEDFRELPKRFNYRTLKSLINTGLFAVVTQGEHRGAHLYKVNRKGVEIIRHFYEVLSGEKKFDETSGRNKLANVRTRTTIDGKRMNLIKKLNNLPAPEKKKPLYRSE